MESALLVEAFKESDQLHGVRYDAVIADGDSGVSNQIFIAQNQNQNRIHS